MYWTCSVRQELVDRLYLFLLLMMQIKDTNSRLHMCQGLWIFMQVWKSLHEYSQALYWAVGSSGVGGGGGGGPCLPFIYYSVRNEEGPGIRLYSL